jgi:hypothetical protein
MSWSLQITHGDFQVESAHLGTVTQHAKLIQDFRCAILEKMGTDNLHPDFGSLIDGGTTPDGTTSNGVIGESDLGTVGLIIETEINRIARYMQRAQLERAKQDKLTYGKATLTPQEVLLQLNGIEMTQRQDSIKVVVGLVSASNNNFDIDLVITA